jgi:hypothetical protein
MCLNCAKFPLQVYTYNGGSDYYDLSLEQMKNLTCIYGKLLHWKKSIPKEEEPLVDTFSPDLYDIWNYELSCWYEWPEYLQKYVLEAKANRS